MAEAAAPGRLDQGVSVFRMWRWRFYVSVRAIVLFILCAVVLNGQLLLADSIRPGCSHWAVFRICQFHGLPVEMKTLMGMLRARSEGHSMRDLVEVLDQLGFKCKEARITSLVGAELPVIAQAAGSGHFEVLTGITGHSVGVLGAHGKYQVLSRESLASRWASPGVRVWRAESRGGSTGLLGSRRGNGPGIEFKSLIAAKDDIAYTTESVVYEFPFKNTGGEALVIRKVVPSCGCVKVDVPEAPVSPGDGATLSVRYHPASGGAFDSNVDIFTNDPLRGHVRATIVGNVSSGVRLSTRSVRFASALPGKEHVCLVGIMSDGSDEFEAEVVKCSEEWIRARVVPWRECRFIEFEEAAVRYAKYCNASDGIGHFLNLN